MNTFLIIIGAIIVFAIYILLREREKFKYVKERIGFEIVKIDIEIEENPYDPLLFARRGAFYQKIQNFPEARKNFITAKKMFIQLTDENEIGNNLAHLDLNLKFIEKPHPWAKIGIRDLSNNWFVFFLIENFGGMRYNFNKK